LASATGEEVNDLNIIEPETLEYLPAATLLRLSTKAQKASKHYQAFKNTVIALPELFRGFEQMDVEPSFDLDNEYIMLQFAGDGAKLKQVWGLLRRNGYNTTLRPQKGETQFLAFWERKDQAQIFMYFTSTLCKRVQVGTEMKEVPIYETQCGDLPEIEADSTEVVVVEDMPF
jgi:hypothetical protein